MEKRRFGRTGHMSTVMIFGGAALWNVSQDEADRAIELAMDHGVNHIDVAPSYGDAELRLGPWMPQIRKQVFLACKTFERGKARAREELHRSLDRLKTDKFDLYQLHAVNVTPSLDEAMGPDSAFEAILEARDEGLVDYVGMTGHGPYAPGVAIQALERFDFDSFMFPVNFTMFTNEIYRRDLKRLLAIADERDIGTMAIKAIAKELWEDRVMRCALDTHEYATWYKPFDDQASIDKCVNFVLSQGVCCLANAGDPALLPKVIDAAERFTAMGEDEQEEFIQTSERYEPLAWLG